METATAVAQLSDVTTVPRLLAWRAAVHPDRVAVAVHGLAELTFTDWDRRATTVAGALRARGVARGQRVVLRFAPQEWVDFAVAYCGVLRAGAVAVPLSDRLAPGQVAYAVDHCEAVAIVHGEATAPESAWRFADLVTDGPSELDDDGPAPRDLAQILYTSGTTGNPKGVGATHANLMMGAPRHPRRLRLAHSDRLLHAFAIGTNAAQTMLYTALQAHPTALTLARSTPARFARLIESAGVGSVFLVPSMAVELLNSGALADRDLSAVQLVGSTAAALPPAVATRLAAAFDRATIVNYYTSTEAAPAQTSMIFDPERPDAVGRAVDGTLRIAGPDGKPLPPGEIGEVWLRSPQPRAYFRDATASRDTFRGDWVRMDDIGRLDADGYLYLVDRHQDVVKSGAFKVSTLEVEAALYEHPHIAEAAVVGVPHPVLGATLGAAVVARPEAPADALELPALRAFLAGRLADYQLPSRVLRLDSLPRNEGGKVLKRQLVTWFDDGRDGESV